MKRKFGFFAFAALLAGAVLAFGLSACSSGGDDTAALMALAAASGGTSQTETSSDSGTQSGGGTSAPTTTPTTTETPGGQNPTPAPTPTVTYVITFNANDGSENPSTVTQNFTAGIAQALIPVEELGFSKAGFSFAGWGRAPKSKQASYADGASYTATANETLYALWSEIPVYSVNIPANVRGTVTASPATGTAGTEITLSNTSNEGYQFTSYAVTDADGTAVTVTGGKFTMPAKNVTVTAVFTAITYTITFNANDGSPNPTTDTQTFTAGTPQALKTIAELGFSKSGFSFAGWGTSADASQASYADAASYTATSSATLYALWSEIPVYSVNIPVNANGSVTANPATATAGMEITLSNTPKTGYKFVSYSVTDADGAVVTVTDGKFTMPAKNVTVAATFSAINYNINVGTFSNGRVTASPTTATFGTSVTLTASPASGYELAKMIVTDSDGTSVTVSGTGNNRTFAMPAKNVTVTATFSAINYSVTVGTIANGNVTASPETATVGTEITLSNTPIAGYKFVSYTVGDADGAAVTVTGGKFTMPAKNVTVSATFTAINYNITIGTFANGSVTASSASATVGTSVTLTASPAFGYGLATLSVSAADGTSISVSGTGDSRTFVMPAQNVTVIATFDVINYNINVGTIANGSVEANPSTATAGTEIALSNTPAAGYEFASYSVRGEDGKTVAVTDGKFTMPAKNVTVSATFTAINYSINVGTAANGAVTANSSSAIVGTNVTLTIKPAFSYGLATLTVSAADGTSVIVGGSGNSRAFTMPAKNVTVTATFAEIPETSGEYTKIGMTEINGVEYDLVTFGLWPQTIKSAEVTIDQNKTKTVGLFTYCKGSDGQWYVEKREFSVSGANGEVKYSDGTSIQVRGPNEGIRYRWFKVEPIKWRVLTTNYNGTGKKLLFAENILEVCAYYDGDDNDRTISGNIVYANNYEYSRIHAFLNGYGYQKLNCLDGPQARCKDFLGMGFLQTAFSDDEQKKITKTSIVNNARSTNPDDNATYNNNENNKYVSDTPTTGKVFLLSVQEATKSEYGFGSANTYGAKSALNRQTTDYVKAMFASSGIYGYWWLRSPEFTRFTASAVKDFITHVQVDVQCGVVPALCVEN